MSDKAHKIAWMTTIVAALGYFVDVYDLVLFSVVRVASLQALGLTGEEVKSAGMMLLNIQMAGMLVGGVFWGIMGDRVGRCAVLFGSIACYSLANIANAFVGDLFTYGVIRFIAGVGLAGELGAGTTLAVELLPPRVRGYGTTLIASVGVLGAILASVVAGVVDWRLSYCIGGVLGLLLLAARISTHESTLHQQVELAHRRVGTVASLMLKPGRFRKMMGCVFVGVPIWFAVGVLITFAPELGQEIFGGEAKARYSVLFGYIGFFCGDVLSGLMSQLLRSRKRVIFLFMTAGFIFSAAYLWLPTGANQLYGWALAVGFSMGYWAVLITTAAEQFGTNVRATVATVVPNFIRGAVIPLTTAVMVLQPFFGERPLVWSSSIVGVFCYIAALFGLASLRETFGVSLDYVEEEDRGS
jgi:putative MFS transporter